MAQIFKSFFFVFFGFKLSFGLIYYFIFFIGFPAKISKLLEEIDFFYKFEKLEKFFKILK